MSYSKTKCSFCGNKSVNHPHGDGCHNCNKGTMKKVDETEEDRIMAREQFRNWVVREKLKLRDDI